MILNGQGRRSNSSSPSKPVFLSADAAKHYQPMISEEQFPYLCAMANKVAAGTHSGVNEFEFGLDLILDGLERLLENKTENEKQE